MSEQKDTGSSTEVRTTSRGSALSRRSFLKYAGASAAAAATFGLVGCDEDNPTGGGGGGGGGENDMVNLGTGNVAILNYAYALEQLEAAFYANVVDNPFSYQGNEEQIFNDIAGHEQTHSEFFKVALADNAIPGLTPDFSSIDFSDRATVLGAAKTFEDLGVSAYNGQGQYIDTSSESGLTYLLLAGKIVSVEARHASAIRDLLDPKSASFAGDDIIDANGLEKTNDSSTVLAAAGKYIEEDIDFSGMPDQQ